MILASPLIIMVFMTMLSIFTKCTAKLEDNDSERYPKIVSRIKNDGKNRYSIAS